jgi:hypothetical protein
MDLDDFIDIKMEEESNEVKSVMRSYEMGNLEKALSYNSEIMLICDKYIAIEYNLLILD